MRCGTFQRFQELTYQHVGIVLRPGKESLVKARVAKRLRALRLSSVDQYLDLLESGEGEGEEELYCFLDAISTNFTHFMRESTHFDVLRTDAERWKSERRPRVRVWCAASSTGEEPYTLAFTLADALDLRRTDCRVLATDISTEVLSTAREGIYSANRLQPIPGAIRNRHFSPVGLDAQGEKLLEASPALKQLLVFKRLNLAKPPFPMRGPLDFVFCRNVMIYFDQPVRQRLVSEIERLLAPGAHLAIGHSESLNDLQTGLRRVGPALFQKPGGEPTSRGKTHRKEAPR